MSRTARSMSSSSARLTASVPSLASATTCRSGSASSTSFRPLRTTSKSSAIRIRVFSGMGMLHLSERDVELNLRAGPVVRADLQLPADEQCSLAHPVDACGVIGERGVDPSPVIAHQEGYVLIDRRQ